ncbi:MAG TPA: MT-A70 family methyltransferase [Pseudolabrys sp.]
MIARNGAGPASAATDSEARKVFATGERRPPSKPDHPKTQPIRDERPIASCAVTDLAFHPLADLFPLMVGAEFVELRDDIKQHGLLEPLCEFEGKLLDGRNRLRACKAAGIPIPSNMVEHFDPKKQGDPLAWVISKNLKRRHLNESQRAWVAAKLANMRQGERTDLEPSANLRKVNQAAAASMLNVSERSIQNAAAVREHGTPELQHVVEQGNLAVSVAANVAKLPADQQREIAEKAANGNANVVHKVIKQHIRKQDEERILGLAPIAGKFKTLVIDPPWQYDGLFLGRGGPDYATMPQEELLALPVPDWAEDNCHLYLWTTNAMFPDAIELMAKWGFRHNTVITWAKPRYGMGTHFRGQTEHVIFGIRGTLRTRVSNIGTWFAAPTGAHSAKPERFYEIVRAASYPPYGEAFQRKARSDFVNLFEQRAAAEAAE